MILTFEQDTLSSKDGKTEIRDVSGYGHVAVPSAGEIESERRWDELFSRPASVALLARMADEALAEADAGRCSQLNVDEL